MIPNVKISYDGAAGSEVDVIPHRGDPEFDPIAIDSIPDRHAVSKVAVRPDAGMRVQYDGVGMV